MQNSEKYDSDIYDTINSVYNSNRNYKVMGGWVILAAIAMWMFRKLKE